MLIVAGWVGVYFQKYSPAPVAKQAASARQHEVVLADNGFTPAVINIALGDTVIFRTTRNVHFWPASDLHPTHDIYAEFDSKQPVLPEQSWSFVFTREGQWPYHDHLFPAFRGMVEVGQGRADFSAQCAQEAESKNCWISQLARSMDELGLEQTLQHVAFLYEHEPLFAGDCHDYLHRIGEKSFLLFTKHGEVLLTNETSYCGYGFFHGFIEAALHQTGSFAQAQEFCKQAETTVTVVLADACYHGLGHGIAAEVVADNGMWGKAQEIIDTSLTLCEQTIKDATKRARCASGAYMELATYIVEDQYNLGMGDGNPLLLCETVQRYTLDCYSQMQVVFVARFKDNSSGALPFIEQITSAAYAEVAVQSYFGSITNVRENGLKELEYCRTLQERLQQACLEGIALAYFLKGNPGQEYIQATAFCQAGFLEVEEASACNEFVLDYGSKRYSEEEYANICKQLPQTYQPRCAQ